METNIKELEVNGVVYVPKDSNNYQPAKGLDGLEYVIVRADKAGVFAGYLVNIDESEQYAKVVLRKCRRLWYWSGAASLSQLSQDGVANPEDCKFPAELENDIRIFGVIEVLIATEKAKQSIQEVEIWGN